AIVKPHFLLVVHRIPKWVRSLCSTLLGPAFSSDYAGDGPTPPLVRCSSEFRGRALVCSATWLEGGGLCGRATDAEVERTPGVSHI
ncbi:unnamed protein product, partial [Pylaiella littoralis]